MSNAKKKRPCPNELHPDAAEAIDRDGCSLLNAFEIRDLATRSPEPFATRRPPKETIHLDKSPVEPLRSYADQMGRIVGRYFVRDCEEVGLRDEGYARLRRLVEKVAATRPFSKGLSQQFAEIEIFKWCRSRLREEVDEGLSVWLLRARERAVSTFQAVVPLAYVEVEAPFMLGKITIAPLDPIVFDRADASFARNFPDASSEARERRSKTREEYAHRTVACVDVSGEPEFANQHARQTAADVATVLRFLSPAAVSHDVTCMCFPMGAEHIPRTTVLRIRDSELVALDVRFADFGFWDWKLSAAYVESHRKLLESLAIYFDGTRLTTFQKRVWTAFSTYSDAIATSDISRRLVLAMSAAEMLLLSDGKEGIQAAVGDRLAFIISREGRIRREIVANFKKAYQLRSLYIHHARTAGDDDVLVTFFKNMFLLIFTVVTSMNRFKDQAAFFTAIDRIKYGG